MSIATGNTITATDFNTLKTRIVAEVVTRRGQSMTQPTATQGNVATSAQVNNLISALRNINTSTTNMALTAQGDLIKAIGQLTTACASFEGNPQVGSNSGCASGCVGLCQGCSGTCTGGCTGSCTGGCTSCTGTCSGGNCGNNCTGCTGGCGTTCQKGCSDGCTGGCGTTCLKGCAQTCSSGCGSTCASACGTAAAIS